MPNINQLEAVARQASRSAQQAYFNFIQAHRRARREAWKHLNTTCSIFLTHLSRKKWAAKASPTMAAALEQKIIEEHRAWLKVAEARATTPWGGLNLFIRRMALRQVCPRALEDEK
ncbi:MAG: hypothetical protein AB1697_04945 [Pseudomonadota bacterium]